MRAPAIATGLVLALLGAAAPRGARADDERAEPPQIAAMQDELTGPKLPPPFVVPELTHPGFDARVDWLVASADGNGTSSSSSSVGLLRPSAEMRLGPLRRVYVGAAWALAGAPSDASGGKLVAGNVEGSVRVVFPMPSWLAFGAGVAVLAPTARWAHGSPAQHAAVAAASLEPTEILALTPDALGVRPVLDMRVVRGPLVAQVRDGLDLAFDTATDFRVRTTGRLLAHFGLLASSDVEVSVEGTQLYFFTNGDYYGPALTDDKRTVMTLGPGVRLAFREIDVGLGASTNLFAPLSDRFDRFYAVRLSVVTHPFGVDR